MATIQSRITAQGQVSIPADVRKKLGVGPGSLIEWNEEDGKVTVRRVGKYTFAEIHKALFGDTPPKRRTLKELKEGIAQEMRRKHARS